MVETATNIQTVQGAHTSKSDIAAAEAIARKHGYIAVIRYKYLSTSSDYTDIVLCRTREHIRKCLENPHYHDAEIVFYDASLAALRDQVLQVTREITRSQDPPQTMPSGFMHIVKRFGLPSLSALMFAVCLFIWCRNAVVLSALLGSSAVAAGLCGLAAGLTGSERADVGEPDVSI